MQARLSPEGNADNGCRIQPWRGKELEAVALGAFESVFGSKKCHRGSPEIILSLSLSLFGTT